ERTTECRVGTETDLRRVCRRGALCFVGWLCVLCGLCGLKRTCRHVRIDLDGVLPVCVWGLGLDCAGDLQGDCTLAFVCFFSLNYNGKAKSSSRSFPKVPLDGEGCPGGKKQGNEECRCAQHREL